MQRFKSGSFIPLFVLLTLALVVGLGTGEDSLMKKNTNTNTAELGQEFMLPLHETVTLPSEGIKIRFDDIVIEQIEPDPIQGKSYPPGTGTNVYFTITKGGKKEQIVLSILSDGYKSQKSQVWEGYVIELIQINQGANFAPPSFAASLRIKRK